MSFEMYDTNGDGRLDFDEMKIVSKGFGLLLDDFGLQQLFNLMDIGKMGTISYLAFEKWWLAGQRSPEKYNTILMNAQPEKSIASTKPKQPEQFVPQPGKAYPKLEI